MRKFWPMMALLIVLGLYAGPCKTEDVSFCLSDDFIAKVLCYQSGILPIEGCREDGLCLTEEEKELEAAPKTVEIPNDPPEGYTEEIMIVQ